MVNIYKLSTMEIYWLSSKIEEIFGIVKTIVKIKETADIDRVKTLSDQDLVILKLLILKANSIIYPVKLQA